MNNVLVIHKTKQITIGIYIYIGNIGTTGTAEKLLFINMLDTFRSTNHTQKVDQSYAECRPNVRIFSIFWSTKRTRITIVIHRVINRLINLNMLFKFINL